MIVLSLGDFVFKNLEVPEKINIGGEQRLVVHELVGGTRVVDVMGKVDDPVSWSGLLFGSDAHDRAKALNNMRKQGKPLTLKWHDVRYTVVISHFKADWERVYRIPYSITVVISEDPSDQAVKIQTVDIDAALRADMGTIVDVIIPKLKTTPATVATVPDTSTKPLSTMDKLKALVADLKAKYTKYTNMAASAMNWTNAQIRDIKGAIQDIQDEIARQLASVSNFLQNVTTLGGVLPNNPVSRSATRVADSAIAVSNQYQLMNLKYTLVHMDNTLPATSSTTAGSSTGTGVTKAGGVIVTSNVLATETLVKGDLYKLASKYYDDVTKWDLIAKANGLTSPYITAPMTVIIPKV